MKKNDLYICLLVDILDCAEKEKDKILNGNTSLWKELGFVYDGSVCDFRRFERGLPPLSYELWLEEGGTKNINSVKYNNYGVKKP